MKKRFMYHETDLSFIIRRYIEKDLIDENWEVRAIDTAKDKIIFRCFTDRDKTDSN